MNKKAQWVGMIHRAYQSEESRKRKSKAYLLKHQGWSVEDIAVNLKVSPSTVRKYLREKPSSEKVTFTVMKKDKPQSPQDRKEIVVMYLMPFVWIPLMGVMLFLWDSLWSVLLSIVFIVFIYKGIVNHMRGKRK